LAERLCLRGDKGLRKCQQLTTVDEDARQARQGVTAPR
jgi:hypothetical protein